MKSNRESGLGCYDVMLVPQDGKNKTKTAYIIEFKVQDSKHKEKNLKDTAEDALKQIREKEYDEELFLRGIEREQIRHYGFAFCGKKVLIMEEKSKS